MISGLMFRGSKNSGKNLWKSLVRFRELPRFFRRDGMRHCFLAISIQSRWESWLRKARGRKSGYMIRVMEALTSSLKRKTDLI